jgi:hypothetical protein
MPSHSKLIGRLAVAASLPLVAALGGKDPAWLIATLAVVAFAIVIVVQLVERHEHRGITDAPDAAGPSPG